MNLDLRFRQDKDYNCGPYALAYFLNLHNFLEDGRELEDQLKPTKKYGTKAQKIVDWFDTTPVNIRTTGVDATWDDIQIPALILYRPGGGSGHYGVAISKTNDYIVIAEPWYARTDKYTKKAFMKIWDGCSAKRWSLNIV